MGLFNLRQNPLQHDLSSTAHASTILTPSHGQVPVQYRIRLARDEDSGDDCACFIRRGRRKLHCVPATAGRPKANRRTCRLAEECSAVYRLLLPCRVRAPEGLRDGYRGAMDAVRPALTSALVQDTISCWHTCRYTPTQHVLQKAAYIPYEHKARAICLRTDAL